MTTDETRQRPGRRPKEHGDDTRSLARNLRAARLAAGFGTIQALADRTGIPSVTLGRYESGSQVPDAYRLFCLAQTCGVTTDSLFSEQTI